MVDANGAMLADEPWEDLLRAAVADARGLLLVDEPAPVPGRDRPLPHLFCEVPGNGDREDVALVRLRDDGAVARQHLFVPEHERPGIDVGRLFVLEPRGDVLAFGVVHGFFGPVDDLLAPAL